MTDFSDYEFFLDLEAQLDGAGARLAKITAEFEQTAPGDDLSRSGRIETKEFIASIRFVLDQLTVVVWKNIVGRELTQEVAGKRLKDIYYPYATDEHMLRTSLGRMIDLKSLDAGNPTMRERTFADWLRSMQPPYAPAYGPLYIIGRLSRLPHQKLIDQRKTRLFAMEAFSANGGGVSMTFKDKPPSFTIWTYRDKHGVATTGVGAHPTPDDPAAELTVFQFDPDTMDFNTVPGAKLLSER